MALQNEALQKYKEEQEEMDEIYNDLSPLKRKKQILKDLEKLQKQEKQGKTGRTPLKSSQKKTKPKKNAFASRPEWDNGGVDDEPVEQMKEHELLKNEKRSIIDNDVIILTKK